MLYTARHFANPPAHMAAIRPFLLSWSFKMSFTAADCMKKHQKSLFGVGYLKLSWNSFHWNFINMFCTEKQLEFFLPAPGQRAMRTLKKEKNWNQDILASEGKRKKIRRNCKEVLDPYKSWLTHGHKKLFANTEPTENSIHEIPPDSLYHF